LPGPRRAREGRELQEAHSSEPLTSSRKLPVVMNWKKQTPQSSTRTAGEAGAGRCIRPQRIASAKKLVPAHFFCCVEVQLLYSSDANWLGQLERAAALRCGSVESEIRLGGRE